MPRFGRIENLIRTCSTWNQRGTDDTVKFSIQLQMKNFLFHTYIHIYICILFFTWNHSPSNSIIHGYLIYVTYQPVKRAPSSRLTRTEFMKQCNFISPVYHEGDTRSRSRILHGVGHIINSCDISHTSYRRLLHTARLYPRAKSD